MVKAPLANARSPKRRRADQNALRQRAEQNRCGEPRNRRVKRFSHHAHPGAVSFASMGLNLTVIGRRVSEGIRCCTTPFILPWRVPKNPTLLVVGCARICHRICLRHPSGR